MAFLFDSIDNLSAESSYVRSLPCFLWNVWKNKNSILYAETQESLLFWVHNAEEEAKLWLDVNKHAKSMLEKNNMTGARERWTPPLQGVVKCNVHVNWRNRLLQSGAAWIARDNTWNVLFHGRDAFTPSANRLIVELRGII